MARGAGGTGARSRLPRPPSRTAPGVADAPEVSAAPGAPETETITEEPSENGDWGYTPMSQWGMDDDAA